jgi:hypothetical protein
MGWDEDGMEPGLILSEESRNPLSVDKNQSGTPNFSQRLSVAGGNSQKAVELWRLGGKRKK